MAAAKAALGEMGAAVNHAQRALDLGTRDPDQLATIGRILAASGDSQGAVIAYERAALAAPASGMIRAQLALALISDGNTDRGLRTLDEAQGLEPRNPVIYRIKAEILRFLGRLVEAEAAARRADELEGAGR